MSLKRKAFEFLGKAKTSGGFGFQDKVQQAGQKMYGYGQQASRGAGQFIEKHPIMAAGGILGGAAVAAEASGLNESIGRQRVGEWLESKPELMQALKNEVGVMKIMEKGVGSIKSKYPNAHKMEMNPHRSNIKTIVSHIEKDPEKMKFLLGSFKPQFKEHIMSSVQSHVDIIHKQAMEGRR